MIKLNVRGCLGDRSKNLVELLDATSHVEKFTPEPLSAHFAVFIAPQ